MLAPGKQIISTSEDGTSEAQSGTSQAAPHVAGAAAILKEINNSLTPQEIEGIFQKTGEIIHDTSLSRNYGNGTGLYFRRLDVYKAVAYVSGYYDLLNVSNTGDSNLTINNITYSEPWIHDVYPNKFVVEPSGFQEVLVYVDPSDLDKGIYSDTIVISSNDPDTGIKIVPLSLRVLSEGCTGDCPPPVSGDWDIDEDTYLYSTDYEIDGDINVSNSLLYSGENRLNATGKLILIGELDLDNANLGFI